MEKIFNPMFFTTLKEGYTAKKLQNDIISGIIVGIVALPLAIAFGVASGVTPEKGLITAVIAGFIISFLGGSRVQIGGPTGAFIVIVFGIVSTYGLDGLLISTILAGLMMIAFGLLRLGTILKYIPHPLIVGFTSGIALVIFSTQIKDAFGLDLNEVPSNFISKWISYFTNAHSINYWSIIITLSTILITVFSKKIFSKIPGSFISIVLLTFIVQFFDLQVNTIETIFGDIPNTFSFDIPSIDWSNITYYLAPAFTIAMLGAIESLLSAVVADGMISDTHRSNTELIAQGAANVITPIFGGIPATGAIARTVTNIKNGGKTPLAGIVHAITLLLIMLFFGNYAKLIPMSCLAGILIVVAYNMSEWRTFISIFRGSRYDIIVLLTTFILTVLVDLTVAIEIGMVLAALLFMQRMSKMSNIVHLFTNGNSNCDEEDIVNDKRIEVFEISGPFFFAAAKKYQEILRHTENNSRVIIIRMRHVPFIDSTGIYNFKDIIKELQANNKKVILSGVRKDVLEELTHTRIAFLIGKANIFENFKDSVNKAKSFLENVIE